MGHWQCFRGPSVEGVTGWSCWLALVGVRAGWPVVRLGGPTGCGSWFGCSPYSWSMCMLTRLVDMHVDVVGRCAH